MECKPPAATAFLLNGAYITVTIHYMPMTREDRFVESSGYRPDKIIHAYRGDYPYGPHVSKRTHALSAKPDTANSVTTRVPRKQYSEKSAEQYFDKFENVDPRVVTLFVNIFPTELIDTNEDFRLSCMSAGLAISRRIHNADIPDEAFPYITQEQLELANNICNMVFLAHRNNDKDSGESFKLAGFTLPEYINTVNAEVVTLLGKTAESQINAKPLDADTMIDALNAYSTASKRVSSIIN